MRFFLAMVGINSVTFAAHLVTSSYIPNLMIELPYLLRIQLHPWVDEEKVQ